MKRNTGLSLVTILVATSIAAIATLFFTRFLSSSTRSRQVITETQELMAMRSQLVMQIDCTATFSPGVTSADCNTTSAPGGQNGAARFFRVFVKSPKGPVALTSGAQNADGSYSYGSWNLRATCSATEGSLVLRAAKPRSGGFEIDKLTKEPMGWDFSRGLLIGNGLGGVPLCFTSEAGSGVTLGSWVGDGAATRTIDTNLDFVPKVLDVIVAGGSTATAPNLAVWFKKLDTMNASSSDYSFMCNDPYPDATGNGWEFNAGSAQGGIAYVKTGSTYDLQLKHVESPVMGGSPVFGASACENGALNSNGRTYYWAAYQ